MRMTLAQTPLSRRRGSAFVLAVAVLAVLALFALTLAYNSKVELMATRNWANGVQSRMAAQTGVELFQATTGRGSGGVLTPLSLEGPSLASSSQSAQSPLQPVTLRLRRQDLISAGGMISAADAQGSGVSVAGLTQETFRAGAEALAQSQVLDLSARININAVLPLPEIMTQRSLEQPAAAEQTLGEATPGFWSEDALARLIEEVMQARKIGGIDARKLAHAIALRRWGADARPGVAGQDDNLNSARADGTADGLDNDGDGWRDEPGEVRLGTARDGLDNNRDGRIDDAGESIDADGLDNNLDGRADEPGEAIDDPAESSADPRRRPLGDDQPYTDLRELMTLPGMTLPAYQALMPYLTVFSSTFAAFDATGAVEGGNGVLGLPQIDPNTAPADRIFEALSRRYPDADRSLLAQFAVNVLDRRDADDVPTTWQLEGVTYYGYEQTPYINEVCPDVISLDQDGDDGQYIELYNPYSRPFDLGGWSVRGGGAIIRLRGTLAAGGLMVLTDDFNEENDPSPENQNGLGSFYAIFGRVGSGSARRLEEYPAMDLINDAGQVQLLDPRGKVVDVFTWRDGKWTGAPQSFQRVDPRVRVSRRAPATPLERNPGQIAGEASRRAIEQQELWQNRPFTSALDLMLVSAAYGEPQTELYTATPGTTPASAVEPMIQPWSLPALETAGARELDLRLIDCFRVGAVLPEDRKLDEDWAELEELDSPQIREQQRVIQARASIPRTPACDVIFGNINLNTASAAVLAALPGMTPDRAARIVQVRNQRVEGERPDGPLPELTSALPGWWQAADPLETPVWRNFSDFLIDEDLWNGAPLYERLDAVYPFAQLVTLHTLALESLTVNRTEEAAQDDPRRSGRILARRMLAADRGVVETLAFDNPRRINPQIGDPDLRTARPVSGAGPILTLERLSAGVARPVQRPAASEALGHATLAPVISNRNDSIVLGNTPQP